ncbi:MAG TPA: hypothetical protein VJT32_04130 [bacterium]|nr:hypothetical protein [bacterium]
MDISSYPRTPHGHAATLPLAKQTNVARSEIVQYADDGSMYTIVILDADDSFDVIIDHPDGSSEAVWSLAREREAS